VSDVERFTILRDVPPPYGGQIHCVRATDYDALKVLFDELVAKGWDIEAEQQRTDECKVKLAAADKRTGWNGNEASPDERKAPEGNWLTHPANWDICDLHQEVFPMTDRCPKCAPANPEAK
jgi:hypothetical protein